jgi:hypothetical protein
MYFLGITKEVIIIMAKSNVSHDPIVIANATAATVAVLFVVCRLAFVLAPELSLSVSRSWFHGIDISLIASQQMGGLVLGLVSSTIAGWLVGFVFAWFQNLFEK